MEINIIILAYIQMTMINEQTSFTSLANTSRMLMTPAMMYVKMPIDVIRTYYILSLRMYW